MTRPSNDPCPLARVHHPFAARRRAGAFALLAAATFWLQPAAAEPPATPPQVEVGKQESHASAGTRAESIASKLGAAKLSHAAAQQHCEMLTPSMMGEGDRKEFQRCCMQRLESGPPAGDQPKARKGEQGL